MANIAFQRIQREFKEVITSDEVKTTGIKLEARDEQMSELSGEIRGPPDTPYEGGIFRLQVKIDETYPFKPPNVKFITRLWHPNVSSQTGAICLDILKDQWAASMTLRTVLLSVQALLSSPEPNDPQDAIVAKQCISEHKLFEETARLWAQIYASAPGDHNPDKDVALESLSTCYWDLKRATERIFS